MPRRPRRIHPVKDALALAAEQQTYGDALIRLSEYSSTKPLSEFQQEVLLHQSASVIDFLGLTLIPQLQSPPCLKASRLVGSARFAHNKKSLIVQVEPKIGNANFLRMR
jgi:hypothetical protein